MHLCQKHRGCGFSWSHNLQFCCRDVNWLCQHRVTLLLAWAALIIHSTCRGVKGLSHCAKVTVYPGKILKNYSFTTLCTWKGKPHRLSLEDYLHFCTRWTLYGLLQGSWRRREVPVVFKWMEINCSATEPLFFEGGWIMCSKINEFVYVWVMCELGNWMESDLGSGFSFTENWWHDLE